MDLCGWGDSDEDLLFARDTSISGQVVQQRQLRIRAQETALEGIANSELRRLLAHNKTFDCVDNKVGDSVLFYNASQKKGNPRRRGPATVPDIDESGAVLKFQSQTFKVARYCVRRKLEEKDLPQGSAAGDSQLNIEWGMSTPLVLPSQDGGTLGIGRSKNIGARDLVNGFDKGGARRGYDGDLRSAPPPGRSSSYELGFCRSRARCRAVG